MATFSRCVSTSKLSIGNRRPATAGGKRASNLFEFDDKRSRLKRPASAREADAGLGIDPYRTWVGISEHRLALVVVASIMAVIAAVAMVVTTFLGSLGSR